MLEARLYTFLFASLVITLLLTLISWKNEVSDPLPSSLSASSSKIQWIKHDHDRLTTVVTAYFPLKKSKHTNREYLSWLENLLGYCESPMIIFTSTEQYSILYKLRRNGTLASYFIVDYATPLQMPPIYPLLSVFEQQHKIDPERAYHSVELYTIWCAKSFMVNRSAELNPFNTKYFLYVDAGAFRSSKYRFRLWPYHRKIQSIVSKDRLLLGMIGSLPRRFCPLNHTLDKGPIKIDLIEGGFIGGSHGAINWWTSIFYDTVNIYASKRFFIAKDQYLMNAIALSYAKRISMILSFRVSCGNSWFAFGPILANDEEKQALSFSLICRRKSLSTYSMIPFENICQDAANLI